MKLLLGVTERTNAALMPPLALVAKNPNFSVRILLQHEQLTICIQFPGFLKLLIPYQTVVIFISKFHVNEISRSHATDVKNDFFQLRFHVFCI